MPIIKSIPPGTYIHPSFTRLCLETSLPEPETQKQALLRCQEQLRASVREMQQEMAAHPERAELYGYAASIALHEERIQIIDEYIEQLRARVNEQII